MPEIIEKKLYKDFKSLFQEESQDAKERIINMIEAVLNLKRDIKGRREDLSPWVVVLGLHKNGKYESYLEESNEKAEKLLKLLLEQNINYWSKIPVRGLSLIWSEYSGEDLK